ncbi:MAG: hypothetical protein JWN67_1522 [Actinomycetia bacterium]|nr:hypothetical protein [Actinomycetes bacterium]
MRFTSTAPKGDGTITACTLEGHYRGVRLRLARPLGDRALVDAEVGRTQAVFDGSRLLRPSWRPRGYRVRYESGGITAWTRTWRRPLPTTGPTYDRCDPSRPAIQLTEGSARTLVGWRTAGLSAVGTRQVRGTTGTLYRGSNDVTLRLEWHEGDRGFSLATASACVDDRPITEAQLLRFAAGLRPKP